MGLEGMGSAQAAAYWYDCLAVDHTVCKFCHEAGKQVPLMADRGGTSRLAFQNKMKAAFRTHVRAEHPDQLAQIAWSRTIRANSAARTARGRPDEKGKTAEPVKAAPARAEPVGTRRSSHPVQNQVEPAGAAQREKAMRAQAQRDTWLRRVNSTPRAPR
jgi:hypothetical protein